MAGEPGSGTLLQPELSLHRCLAKEKLPFPCHSLAPGGAAPTSCSVSLPWFMVLGRVRVMKLPKLLVPGCFYCAVCVWLPLHRAPWCSEVLQMFCSRAGFGNERCTGRTIINLLQIDHQQVGLLEGTFPSN